MTEQSDGGDKVFSAFIEGIYHRVNVQLLGEVVKPPSKDEVVAAVQEFDTRWEKNMLTAAQKEKIAQAGILVSEINLMYSTLREAADEQEGDVQKDAQRGIEYFKTTVYPELEKLVEDELRSIPDEMVADVLIGMSEGN